MFYGSPERQVNKTLEGYFGKTCLHIFLKQFRSALDTKWTTRNCFLTCFAQSFCIILFWILVNRSLILVRGPPLGFSFGPLRGKSLGPCDIDNRKYISIVVYVAWYENFFYRQKSFKHDCLCLNSWIKAFQILFTTFLFVSDIRSYYKHGKRISIHLNVVYLIIHF